MESAIISSEMPSSLARRTCKSNTFLNSSAVVKWLIVGHEYSFSISLAFLSDMCRAGARAGGVVDLCRRLTAPLLANVLVAGLAKVLSSELRRLLPDVPAGVLSSEWSCLRPDVLAGVLSSEWSCLRLPVLESVLSSEWSRLRPAALAGVLSSE